MRQQDVTNILISHNLSTFFFPLPLQPDNLTQLSIRLIVSSGPVKDMNSPALSTWLHRLLLSITPPLSLSEDALQLLTPHPAGSYLFTHFISPAFFVSLFVRHRKSRAQCGTFRKWKGTRNSIHLLMIPMEGTFHVWANTKRSASL